VSRLAEKVNVRFHIAGVIAIFLGAAGAVVSLFWDVIYKSKAFSLSAVGPFKLLGLAAGLALIAAGAVAGVVLGRRISARAGLDGMPAPQKGYGLIGYLLILGGLGGTFISLLWDVIRRGRPFNASAIGPMKMMGIAAGIVIMVIGIVMVAVMSRKRAAAPARSGATAIQPAASPQQQGASTPPPDAGYPSAPAPLYQLQTPETGYQPAPASEYYPQTAETAVTAQQPEQPQEEIPFALPIEDAYPAQAGAEPMEAIPVDVSPGEESSADGKGY
jgi:hypothetical protein